MFTPEEKQTLIKAITTDPHISDSERRLLTEKIQEEGSTLRGILGGGTAMVISKFLKLSKHTQVLLTIAGYGIGKYLLDKTPNRDKLLEYNDKSKNYKVNV